MIGKAIFNNSFEMQRLLGEGLTSRVYLCEDLEEPTHKVAVKILRGEYGRKRSSHSSSQGVETI